MGEVLTETMRPAGVSLMLIRVVSLVLLLGVRNCSQKDLSEGSIVSQLEPQKFTLIKYLSPVSGFIMKVLVFNYYYLFYIYRTKKKSRSFRFKHMFKF